MMTRVLPGCSFLLVSRGLYFNDAMCKTGLDFRRLQVKPLQTLVENDCRYASFWQVKNHEHRNKGSIFYNRKSNNAGRKFKSWDNRRVSGCCEEAMGFQMEKDAYCALAGKTEKAVLE